MVMIGPQLLPGPGSGRPGVLQEAPASQVRQSQRFLFAVWTVFTRLGGCAWAGQAGALL